MNTIPPFKAQISQHRGIEPTTSGMISARRGWGLLPVRAVVKTPIRSPDMWPTLCRQSDERSRGGAYGWRMSESVASAALSVAGPSVAWNDDASQPSLSAQLAALSVEHLEERVRRCIGDASLRVPSPSEFSDGYQKRRKDELVSQLAAAYASIPLPRTLVRCSGWPIPDEHTAPLLAALRALDWSEHARPAVQAAGYVILKRPWALKPRHANANPRWAEADSRSVRRRVWELACEMLARSPGKGFEFTRIALSKGFRGSPHTDRNDLAVQYLLSLGDFTGGGERLMASDWLLIGF